MYKLVLVRKKKIKHLYHKALKTHKYMLKKTKGKNSVQHVNGKLSDAVGLNYNKEGSSYTLGHFKNSRGSRLPE